MSDFIRNEVKELVFYLGLFTFMVVIIPLFFGFVGKGFEESFIEGRPFLFGDLLSNYLIYLFFMIPSMLVIIFPIASMFVLSRGEHPATKPNPTFIRIFTTSFIHAPEQGMLYWLSEISGFSGKRNFMNWSRNILRLLAVSIIFFGLYGIIQVSFPASQVTAIPEIAIQQVTKTMEVYFAIEPPAWTETATMLFVFMLLMGLNAYVTARFQLGKTFYYLVGLIFIAPLIGLFWMGFHSIVYGASQTGLIQTFIFGWFGSTLTLLFGSFFLWYIFHFMNNLFAKLVQIIPSNADIIFIAIISLIVFTGFYIGIEVLLSKAKGNKPTYAEDSV
tara:strand:+ start:5984 stop:6976 length:993 start_codon:yes stop_codon:yes gene_type:complete